jgi:hypothetical protein
MGAATSSHFSWRDLAGPISPLSIVPLADASAGGLLDPQFMSAGSRLRGLLKFSWTANGIALQPCWGRSGRFCQVLRTLREEQFLMDTEKTGIAGNAS